MLQYSIEDVFEALEKADNVNAALKKFLKTELTADQRSARFVKDMRTIWAHKDTGKRQEFIKNKLPDCQHLLFGVTRYAYPAVMAEIANGITDRYADKFNQTYKLEEGSLVYQDKKKFEEIVTLVRAEIKSELEKAGVPASPFMQNVLLFYIFDAEVLTSVIEALQ